MFFSLSSGWSIGQPGSFPIFCSVFSQSTRVDRSATTADGRPYQSTVSPAVAMLTCCCCCFLLARRPSSTSSTTLSSDRNQSVDRKRGMATADVQAVGRGCVLLTAETVFYFVFLDQSLPLQKNSFLSSNLDIAARYGVFQLGYFST